jgi:hypothetical protein
MPKPHQSQVVSHLLLNWMQLLVVVGSREAPMALRLACHAQAKASGPILFWDSPVAGGSSRQRRF